MMKLSIIVPAWNEAQLLPACLASIDAAVDANQSAGFTHEVIVVDNNSTDKTAEIAAAAGALVVFEPINQIARARNAGAAAASGDWLLFIDADSLLSSGLLFDIHALIDADKAVGCGSTMQMQGLPWWGRSMMATWTTMSLTLRWAAGSLLVCRAEAFREVGGFNTQLYAAEEIDLSQRLKRWGRERGQRFEILRRHPLQTSNRKLLLYSGREIGAQLARLMLRPWAALRDRAALSLWYDGRR